MKHIFHHPTARLWAVSGLTGMVLLAGILLDEGQAGTMTTPPIIEGTQIQNQTLQKIHKDSIDLVKKSERDSGPMNARKEGRHQDSVNKQEPAKKKLGLALLFLGVLAEKS
jgi:hypothetical protein